MIERRQNGELPFMRDTSERSGAPIDAGWAAAFIGDLASFQRDLLALTVASDPLLQAPGCGATELSGQLSRGIRDRAVAGRAALLALSDMAGEVLAAVIDSAWSDIAQRGNLWEGEFVVERIDRPVLSAQTCDYAQRTYAPSGPCGRYSPGSPTAGFISLTVDAPHTAPRDPAEIGRMVMSCDIDGLHALAARWQGIGRDLDSVAGALLGSKERWPRDESAPVVAARSSVEVLIRSGREIAGQFVAMSGAIQVFARGAGEARAGLLRIADERAEAASHLARAPELQLTALGIESTATNDLFHRSFVMALVSSARQLPRFTHPDGSRSGVPAHD